MANLKKLENVDGYSLELENVSHAVKWCKPKGNWICTNVDTGIPWSSALKTLGSVRRNSDGLVLMASTTSLMIYTILCIL
ncbi:hypothetical protein LguiA_021562 [Lonicera macranthoides]